MLREVKKFFVCFIFYAGILLLMGVADADLDLWGSVKWSLCGFSLMGLAFMIGRHCDV